MKRLSKGGFTLIEMLIVLVVIGALVAIVLPRFAAVARDARTKQCAANIHSIDNAIELFNSRTGAYPTAITAVTKDTTYFPDGEPTCPLTGGAYGLDATNNRCDRAGHFAIGDWTTHLESTTP